MRIWQRLRGVEIRMLVRNGLFLVLMGYILYLIVRPGHTKPILHQYLGEPLTGCAYPVDNLDLNRLIEYSEQGPITHWDEFQSKEQAEFAGYEICE